MKVLKGILLSVMMGLHVPCPVAQEIDSVASSESVPTCELTRGEERYEVDSMARSEIVPTCELTRGEERYEVDSVASSKSVPTYELTLGEEWERMTLNGKLKMKGLPLSPNLNVYMVRDSLINISIRAPFIGEAGRLVLTKDTILGVNKINKTFTKQAIGEYTGMYQDCIGDIQSLLLGNFFIPGQELTEENFDELIEVYAEDEQINVVPKGAAVIEGVKYGYVVDTEFKPIMIIILPEKNPSVEIDILYEYELKGYKIQFMMSDGQSLRDATLEFKEPEPDGKEPKEIELGKKYRQVDLNEFLKRIGG